MTVLSDVNAAWNDDSWKQRWEELHALYHYIQLDKKIWLSCSAPGCLFMHTWSRLATLYYVDCLWCSIPDVWLDEYSILLYVIMLLVYFKLQYTFSCINIAKNTDTRNSSTTDCWISKSFHSPRKRMVAGALYGCLQSINEEDGWMNSRKNRRKQKEWIEKKIIPRKATIVKARTTANTLGKSKQDSPFPTIEIRQLCVQK